MHCQVPFTMTLYGRDLQFFTLPRNSDSAGTSTPEAIGWVLACTGDWLLIADSYQFHAIQGAIDEEILLGFHPFLSLLMCD